MTPWTAARKAPLSSTISQSLLKFMAIESLILSNHLNLCWPLLLLPSLFPSIRVFPVSWLFASGGQSIGASSFSISPFNKYSGLISFRIDWFDRLSVQGTLRVFSNESGGKSTGVLVSASVLPMNIQEQFPLGWLIWSLCCPWDSQESSPTPEFRSIISSVLSCLYDPTLTLHMTTGKTTALTRWTFFGKVISLLFNI